MSTAPRFGLFLPPFDALADPRLLADLAAAAEESGWDGLFLWDHLLYADPVRAILDPWIALAAVASATSTLRLGPMVTPLTRRRPQVLARQAVTLDLLARGRLVLGVGLGDDGSVRELSSFGEVADPRTRAERLDEALDVLVPLLTGQPVSHSGRHLTVDGVRFLPASPQPNGPPIWVAGRWPNRAPLRRAARYDGAFVINIHDEGQVAELAGVLEELRPVGHPGEVVVELPAGADASAWAAAGATWLLTGFSPYRLDAQAVAARIAEGPPRS